MRLLIAALVSLSMTQLSVAQSRTQQPGTNTPAPAPQSSPAPSALSDLNLGVGLSLSSAGIGGHVSIPLKPSVINARFGLNYFSYSYNGNTGDVDFGFKLGMQSYDALLDWFPFEGSFRLTAGMVYNANKITANGRPNIAGRYLINGHSYDAGNVGNLKGSITFPSVVPYLGFGFGNTSSANSRWTFFSDTGILLNSAPSAKVRTSNCTASPTVCADLDRDLGELNNSLNDAFRLFKIYPIVRIGIAYRF
jgi:hypothetical protein